MAWKEPIPPAGNKQGNIESYIQPFDNNLISFYPKCPKSTCCFGYLLNNLKPCTTSAQILSPLWIWNSTLLYFMPTKPPPVHKSGKLLMECHGVRCRAEQYSPGVKVMPHHHVQGMNEWWNTCRNVIWLCFFLSTKNTSNKKGRSAVRVLKNKKDA